jgi:LuxR family maltose regulon positive regulatory protein
MPRVPFYTLLWSRDRSHYELYTQGQFEQIFSSGDQNAWLTWLDDKTSFAFQGACGRLNVYRESRRHAREYWYAYHTTSSGTRKCYLGRTTTVTFARLEKEAKALGGSPEAPLVPLRTQSTPKAKPQELDLLKQERALLKSKLSAPRRPPSLVERVRLFEALNVACSSPLTLLCAPAGSGKTTLLSAWAVASPRQVAWLSLDELDNDLTRFWVSVLAALRITLPEVGESVLTMLFSPQPPPTSTILTALLNELGEQRDDIFLILDDYQVIEEVALNASVAFLLDHQPSNLHLIISSRTDPELPLSRLRVRGNLVEIRDQDLRFRLEETASFLSQMIDVSLSHADVATLWQRTEGWIAGLQLAALSLRQHEDVSAFLQTFAGSHRFLLDYIQQEILAPLEPSLRHFLLASAILSRLSAPLCQAVTEEEESQQLLERIERANLFLVPLDEERNWYRFHDLFREVLLARLQASQAELVPHLHLRAARWYEAQGQMREAIAHALEARDFAFAASLMERVAPQIFLGGEVRILQTWIAALPDAVLQQYTSLTLNTALRCLQTAHTAVKASYSRMLIQVEETMARVEAVAHSPQDPHLEEEERIKTLRRLRLLRVLIASKAIIMQGDTERLRQLAQEVESLVENEEISWKMVGLYLTFLLIEFLLREGVHLIKRLLLAKQQARDALDLGATVRIMHWLAYAYVKAGQLHQAEQECLEALVLVEQIGKPLLITGYLYYPLARISYAWNRLEEASRWLHQMLRIGQDWQTAELLIAGKNLLAWLQVSTNDYEAADQTLQEAEALVQQEQNALFTFWVTATRVHYWLATGNLVQAEKWAASMEFSQERWNPNHKEMFLMQMRVFLAQHRSRYVVEVLQRWSQQFDQSGDIEATIAYLVLQMVALHQAGRREQAVRVAARLFAMTEPERHIRIYLDAGPPMKQTLLALLQVQPDETQGASGFSRAFVSTLLDAFEQEEKHTRKISLTPTTSRKPMSSPQQIASPVPAFLEPLTPREQEVLHWLARGASNQEIARKLVIQLSTVKKHVSNLLTKLGVESRTQAIAQARIRSLL